MKRPDLQRVEKMLDFTSKLNGYVHNSGITAKDLSTDLYAQWTVTTLLLNIGEEARKILPEFREARSDVKWWEFIGLSHRLIDNYGLTIFVFCVKSDFTTTYI